MGPVDGRAGTSVRHHTILRRLSELSGEPLWECKSSDIQKRKARARKIRTRVSLDNSSRRCQVGLLSLQVLFNGTDPVYSIHKLVLDDLGVNQVATVVGGSMGGMLVLEFAYFGQEYVRSIVPIATSARHSAWGISWGEAQRQSIYSDPKYEDGYYTFEDPPTTGLGAARMSAMLTYRSRDSFESRFGRNTPDASKGRSINGAQNGSLTPTNEHWSIHNHGHKSTRSISRPASSNGIRNGENHVLTPEESMAEKAATITDPQFSGTTLFAVPAFESKTNKPMHHYYSAQSYLRYQGTKFVGRFDANCYIAITRKLDTHDVARNRAETVKEALQQIKQPTLILGIESDGLFTFAEQEELADGIPNNKLRKIDSPEGHDAFLLQFEQVNKYLLDFFREVLPEIMERQVDGAALEEASDGVGKLTKSSVFGEAEVEDLTAW